jgi:hypothetical protein
MQKPIMCFQSELTIVELLCTTHIVGIECAIAEV